MKKKLKDICKITSGQSAPQNVSDYIENGKTFIKVSNLDDIIADDNENRACKISDEAIEKGKLKLFPANTVIFAKSGLSCVKNRVYVTKEPAYLVNHFCCLYDFDENIMTKWFAYFLRAYNVTNLIKDYAYPSIPIKEIGQIYVSITPLPDQIKITAELDTIQSAIDNKKQQLALLDEAVKSKFNGLIIENGEWKKEKLGKISESILGKMLDKSKQGDEKKFPYLANFNIKWFDFDLSELNEMPFSEKEMEKFQLKIGDILMCEGGEIGRCAVWNNELQNCYFQKALHRIRVNYDLLNPTYLVHWFKLKCDTNSFDDLVGKGATFKHLTGEKLKTIEIPVPPLDLQNQFAAFVQQIDKSKSLVKQQIADLQELLDSKLQEYFGE